MSHQHFAEAPCLQASPLGPWCGFDLLAQPGDFLLLHESPRLSPPHTPHQTLSFMRLNALLSLQTTPTLEETEMSGQVLVSFFWML